MNKYSYLLKYIIIGDASNQVNLLRCGEVLFIDAVSLREVQV